MEIVLKLAGTFILTLFTAFALIPGGFGLSNYKRKASPVRRWVATLFWFTFCVSHILAIVNLWYVKVHVIWSFLIPIALHILFFSSVGRDVSTSGHR